jgi:hypothetical protein
VTMKPQPQDHALLVCKVPDCMWTYAHTGNSGAEEIARYHAIQVHNNQKAIQEGRF